MGNNTGSRKRIGSTDTAFDIIELILTRERAGVTEIAAEVGVSKSTAHAHLQTLKSRGYVIQTRDGQYRLGLQFLAIGGSVQNTIYRRIYRNSKPEIDELAEKTTERAQIMVEENGDGVYLYQAEGSRAVMTDSYIGKRVPLHSTAVGKAYLSQLSRDAVDSLVDFDDLTPHTENTITDRDEFFEVLDDVREQSLAFDYGERVDGIRCVAAPINTDEEEVLGAVSVSGPRNRMEGSRFEETIPELVQNAARVIGLNITYS